MSDAAVARNERDEKMEWFLRPLKWAYQCATCGSIFAGLIWFNADVDASISVWIALAALLGTAGLIAWGIRRVHSVVQQVARGRY